MFKNVGQFLILIIILLTSTFLAFFVFQINCSENPIINLENSETTDWPMFHKNLKNTGKTELTAPIENKTLWKFNTGGQVGSPLVIDDVVYVGAYDRKIYALNANNGEKL